MNIALSPLDTARFSVVTAKTFLEADSSIEDVVSWCEDNSVEMLIARCSSGDIQVARRMEQAGFMLTDTLVYYRLATIVTTPPQLPAGYTWRYASEVDADSVEQLAAAAFRGYSGHYHADLRLDARDADAVYSSWARNSCIAGSLADAVILICHDGVPVAFLTLKKLDDGSCDIPLNGVSPQHQRKGLYAALVTLACNWAEREAQQSIIISTQLPNLAVQKVWCRRGFEPLKSVYTFHKWFTA